MQSRLGGVGTNETLSITPVANQPAHDVHCAGDRSDGGLLKMPSILTSLRLTTLRALPKLRSYYRGSWSAGGWNQTIDEDIPLALRVKSWIIQSDLQH
jgi:hypothetical protein